MFKDMIGYARNPFHLRVQSWVEKRERESKKDDKKKLVNQECILDNVC